MNVILTHENADFDALAASWAAHKLNRSAVPVLPLRLNANVAQFMALYRGALPFVERTELRNKRIQHITLVDTHRQPQIKGLRAGTPTLIIEHHTLTRPLDAHETFTGDVLGATTTLLVEQIQAHQVAISALEATLFALGIYEDTGSLTYRTTTPRDIRAAAWLLEQGAALDTVRRFLEPPLSDEQQALLEKLISAAVSRRIEGFTVIVCALRVTYYIEQLNAVAHRIRDALDPHAVILLVTMPRGSGEVTFMIGRSNHDSIDVGEVAAHFGGGGHSRAASASIDSGDLERLQSETWQVLERTIRPALRVADLMSYGVQTIEAGTLIKDRIGWMRRVGHEGYPVVENGRIVGLLTRRDADRALEHGLDTLTAREIMSEGAVVVTPDEGIEALELRMVESGWGQIPVVDADGALIGIVTRTDLIKHWVRTHHTQPTTLPASPQLPIIANRVAEDEIAAVLGEGVAKLLALIAQEAETRGLRVYIVGGVVRDLLLKRPNLDIDFVVESSQIGLENGMSRAGIAFAEALAAAYGGTVHSFAPFGTAKWKLDSARLGLAAEGLPDHLDFATTRSEFYQHPTALPTVYSGSVKLDLSRRDFTINTLALQIAPMGAAQGQIIDEYGGLKDLRAGVIRVLHSLSLVDDPTRILRAVRFEVRLNFRIEQRTASLVRTALPMLRRITGERLRNELSMLLREAQPERGLFLMQTRSILTAIHPGFVIADMDALEGAFKRAHSAFPDWVKKPADIAALGWHLIGAFLPDGERAAVLTRLMVADTQIASINAGAEIVRKADRLNDSSLSVSQVDKLLHGASDMALIAAWLSLPATHPLAQERIQMYATQWREVRPHLSGDSLRSMGMKPGPCFRMILERLRDARLDMRVTDEDGERRLVAQWLDEGLCDDSAGQPGDHP
jgi:tRNA nucleotidyltransferase (CCA-adding enzyme)